MARRRLPPPFAMTTPQDMPRSAAMGLTVAPMPDTLPVPVRPPVARVAAESAAEAALRELSQEMESLRAQGRMVLRLPLSAIAQDHLLRDRLHSDADEAEALAASIRAHGQRSPIEVCETAPGRYGLISGWRRLHALRGLSAEDPGRFGHVLAFLRSPETASEAYVAMIEENEIRVGLSYWERARIVLRAAKAGVFPDARAALRVLFASASRAKRSKIGSFMALVEALEGDLRFPAALNERMGLQLAQVFGEDPGLAVKLKKALAACPSADPAAEQALIQDLLGQARSRTAAQVSKPGSGAAVRPARQPLGPGLWLVEKPGQITLAGPGLSSDLAARIADLIRSETAG